MEPSCEDARLLLLLNGGDGDAAATGGVRIQIVLHWKENKDPCVNKVWCFFSICLISPVCLTNLG